MSAHRASHPEPLLAHQEPVTVKQTAPQACSTEKLLTCMAEGYVFSLLPGTQDFHIVRNFLKSSWEGETDFCSEHLDDFKFIRHAQLPPHGPSLFTDLMIPPTEKF